MVLFLLGIGMAILGMAFLLLPEMKLPERKQLKPLPRILVGVALLSFFPLYFAIYPFLEDLPTLYAQLIQWGLFFFCLVLAFLILMLATKTKAKKIQAGKTLSNAKSAQPKVRTENLSTSASSSSLEDSENPFHFS